MTVFTDKVQKYLPRMMSDLNITKEQASGIFGNIGTETGGFMALQEIKPTVKGSRGGYGWLQWTGPRRKTYEAWCKAKSLDPSADETNYLYLVHETTTDEKASLVALRRTPTVEAATETFMTKNLRPGVANLTSRKKYANIAYNVPITTSSAPEHGSAGAIVVAGGAALTQTPHHYWPWIIGGTLVAALVTWLIVRLIRKGS